MEGYFRYSGVSDDYVEKLRNEKQVSLICSLSKTYQDGLMWSFYSDEHKGCCIELEVTGKIDWRRIPVNYTNTLPDVDDRMKSSVVSDIDYILSTKSEVWKNEQEIRYVKSVKPRSRIYLNIRVHRVFLGIRISQQDERLIKKIIDIINASRPKQRGIEVIKLKRSDIDFGYSR
jgi:hypothetical protein